MFGHVGFVVDKLALGQIFSEYFSFPCQFPLHQLLSSDHDLSTMAGTIGNTGPSTNWTQYTPLRIRKN
jgi:hypothetical protein